jgi:hypothetical protein
MNRVDEFVSQNLFFLRYVTLSYFLFIYLFYSLTSENSRSGSNPTSLFSVLLRARFYLYDVELNEKNAVFRTKLLRILLEFIYSLFFFLHFRRVGRIGTTYSSLTSDEILFKLWALTENWQTSTKVHTNC